MIQLYIVDETLANGKDTKTAGQKGVVIY